MNFQMKHFFGLGRIIFLIVLVCYIINVVISWPLMNLASKVSGVAMSLFYCLLVLVFNRNYKDTKKIPQLSEKQINDAIMEEFKIPCCKPLIPVP